MLFSDKLNIKIMNKRGNIHTYLTKAMDIQNQLKAFEETI